MTFIEFSEFDDKIVAFEIKGHTNIDTFGKDIVCASISSTVLMTINGLIDVKKIKKLNYKIVDGYVFCDLRKTDDDDLKSSQDLLISLKKFLNQISKDYPKNVKFRIRRYEK